MTYDPNATGIASQGIFGFPYDEDSSEVVLVPVPWDVTTSYGKGTSLGPESILASSSQLDVCDPIFGDFYERGIYMQEVSEEWQMINEQFGMQAGLIQRKLELGDALTTADQQTIASVNKASVNLNNWLSNQSCELLDRGKIVGVVGGDHSSPFGLIKALTDKYSDLSILHIDAHMDLRKAYQGFQYSHASIMRNVCDELPLSMLVQLGIRDFCPEERDYSRMSDNIITHFDSQTQLQLAKGNSWYSICQEIIEPLSDNVYISFDIDGLSPDLCPHTGTPVPGGLSFTDVSTLFYVLRQSQRKVVGFDLCEVAPSEELDCWDGNVGARILYKLCGTALS